jgi:ATP-binding protein involved in chromosome partitioning
VPGDLRGNLDVIPTMTHDSVLEALRGVIDPDLRRDIVSLGFVKNLVIEGGRVAFDIELTTPACPVKDLMKAQAESLVRALPDVTAVDITMTAQVRAVTAASSGGATAIPGVKNVIAVGAGKGGVGKTTVAVNLALALSKAGSRVGILDGDIYGPNVPIMLGLQQQLEGDGDKIRPAEKFGLQVVSIGFMTKDEAPVIWRGPMLHSAIRQFFHDVAWRDLDYLIIDMPPGTGDVALSLAQTVPVAGAIVVTTPQQVSLADSRRAIRMYDKLKIDTLGVIENMSYYACPSCHHTANIFGHGGGEKMAAEMGVPFLGRLPIYEPIRKGSDVGIPLVAAEPQSEAALAFGHAAAQAAAQVSMKAIKSALDSKGHIPLTPVS